MFDNDNKGFPIDIFVEKTPNGDIKYVEKGISMGLCMVCSRNTFANEKRSAFSRPGVYLLWGDDPETGKDRAYIGKTGSLRDRIKGHYRDRDKDFFEHVLMFTSRGDDISFNETIIMGLEALLILKAKEVNRYKIKQTDSKSFSPDKSGRGNMSKCKDLFDDMMSILPVIGVDIFVPLPSAKKERPQATKIYYLSLNKGAEKSAEGYLSGEKFVVLKGSLAKKEDVRSLDSYYKEIRARLIKEKVLKDEGEFYCFAQSYEFSSTSKAGAVISGSNTRGPEAWRDENDKSIRENQIAQLEGEQGVRVVDESKKLPVATQQKECVFVDKKEGIDATGYYYKKQNKKLFVVVVKKGNCAKRQGLGKLNTGSKKARKTLIESGALVAEGNFYRFTVDSKFNSPSQAAAILAGKEINGLKAWRDKESDKMLKELQES